MKPATMAATVARTGEVDDRLSIRLEMLPTVDFEKASSISDWRRFSLLCGIALTIR